MTRAITSGRSIPRHRRMSFPQLVTTWIARSDGRRSLQSLDAHMLRDIGVSPLDVEHELRKPFWRE